MTTATLTETPAPVTTPAPVEADLASILYAPAVPVTTPAPDVLPSPSPIPEPGPGATPTASAPSTETAKIETPPVGPETTEPKETKEPKSDDKGHAAAARRLGSELAEMKRELRMVAEENRVLKAKADGTYEEPTQPTSQEIEARAEFKGRETASRAIAEGQYGAEVIKAQIYDDASPYKTLVSAQPWLHARVANSPQPTVEAMKVLKEQEFLKAYGTDSTQWVAKIEAELRPRILDEFKKQTVKPVTGTKAPSVTEGRGSGGLAPEQKSLADILYGASSAMKGS